MPHQQPSSISNNAELFSLTALSDFHTPPWAKWHFRKEAKIDPDAIYTPGSCHNFIEATNWGAAVCCNNRGAGFVSWWEVTVISSHTPTHTPTHHIHVFKRTLQTCAHTPNKPQTQTDSGTHRFSLLQHTSIYSQISYQHYHQHQTCTLRDTHTRTVCLEHQCSPPGSTQTDTTNSPDETRQATDKY